MGTLRLCDTGRGGGDLTPVMHSGPLGKDGGGGGGRGRRGGCIPRVRKTFLGALGAAAEVVGPALVLPFAHPAGRVVNDPTAD